MSTTNVNVAGKEIVVTRLLEAPAKLVFEAWTQPAHLAHWYGPDGFTITSISMEAKPGGSWRFTMHGPDGKNYPNKITFLEVEKPSKLVYKHSGDDAIIDVHFDVTVTFETVGRQTLLTMRSVFASAADLERVNREYGAVEGARQTVGRLAAYLIQVN